jgi:hypothetical protein
MEARVPLFNEQTEAEKEADRQTQGEQLRVVDGLADRSARSASAKGRCCACWKT